jgi:NAD(P)-dependent dehydrogenase (short-subunit alcohol dehydrogenase family)
VKFDPIQEISIETFDRILATNLRAPFILAKMALPLFKSSIELGKKPCIINIASTRALMSEPNNEAYSASKGGVVALTHALANSLGPNIRVNCVSPGWIEMNNYEALKETDHKQHLVGRVGLGKDIAEMCWFLSQNEKSGFITGQNFVVDGGMTKKMIYEE